MVLSKIVVVLKNLSKATLLAFVFLLVRSYWRFRRAVEDTRRSGIPIALKRITILGFLPQISRNYNRLYDFRKENYEKVEKQLGKPVKTICYIAPMWIATPVIATKDPVVVRHILRDNFENWLKSDILLATLGDLLGKGIFAVNHGQYAPDHGEAWMFQRKTASKVFTRNKFKGHVYKTLLRNSDKLQKNIEKRLELEGKMDAKIIIPMQKQIFRFTLDSIGDIGFGVDLNTLGAEVEDQIDFANAFDSAQMLIAQRVFTVGWQLMKKVYPSELKIRDNISTLDSFCYKIIDERLIISDEELNERGDILSLFLQTGEKEKLTRKFLRDILMSFFIAGRDTTACTLTFALYMLSLPENKSIQEKLHEEIKLTLKKNNAERITLEHLEEMEYLNGVVWETLRLFPPVPFDGKEAARADVLPGGHLVPAKTKVAWDAYAMGRDESVYEDADRLKPERWCGSDGLKFDQFNFPVFQAGPRICLGKDLALFEAKVCICELLKSYSFDFAEDMTGKPAVYKPGITLTFNGNLNLKIQRRE